MADEENEEFRDFENLTRKLLKVPKTAIDPRSKLTRTDTQPTRVTRTGGSDPLRPA